MSKLYITVNLKMLWMKPDSFNIQKHDWSLKCSELFPLFMTINILARLSKGLPDTGIYGIKCLDCDWKSGNQCILGFKATHVAEERNFTWQSYCRNQQGYRCNRFFFLIGPSFYFLDIWYYNPCFHPLLQWLSLVFSPTFTSVAHFDLSAASEVSAKIIRVN